MSTIYTDAVGNKYFGDCQWANHDINYPSISWLKANPHSSINAAITNIVSGAGLQLFNLTSQSTFNAFTTIDVTFASSGDSINRRYSFTGRLGGLISFQQISTVLNNDAGSAIVAANSNPFGSNSMGLVAASSSIQEAQWAGCSNGSSLAICASQITSSTGARSGGSFFFAGLLANINTNFNYYSANNITKSVVFWGANNGAVVGMHYIANASKTLLGTGDASYSIACSDGQTPTAQWATDMYVFDNNATLGYPCIGRVPNMLLGIGSYTYMKPVKIQGSVFPDGGSPWYLPVGTFAGKTLLMRCYSSMT